MKKELMHIINLEAINLPEFKELRGKDWITYGEKNLFPEKLVELLQTSAIHGTAIQAKLDAVIGEGIIEIGDSIINQNDETLNDIYEKIAFDYITFGGYSLNIIWNRAGDAIAEIYHLPFNKVRSGKLNEDDKIDTYYFSSNWANVRKYVPKSYTSYNPMDTRGDNSSQIYYYYDYSPASDVYPLPTYMGAVNDIELDSRISKFHNANISNGMSPSIFINMPNGEPSPEEQRELYRGINESFTGENNAGRVFLSFSDGNELAPQITTVPSANDSYYVVLEERISSRILTAHRITSPLLVGIRDSSGLGNNADEIETAFTHFMSTVIEPIQKGLNKSLGKITKRMGIEAPIAVTPSTIDFNKNIEGTL